MGLAGREHVSSARPPLVRILFVPQRRRARLDIGLSGMELPTRGRGVWVSGPAETAANRVLGVCRGTGGGVWPPLKLHHAALAAAPPPAVVLTDAGYGVELCLDTGELHRCHQNAGAALAVHLR